MIEVVSSYFEEKVNLIENKVTILEIHDKLLLRKIIKNINLEILTKISVSKINFYEVNKKINLEKNCLIISDYFNIDFNNSTILKNLYLRIENDIIKEGKYNKINELYNEMYNSYKDILHDYDFPFEFKNNLKVTEYLKFISLKFSKEDLCDPLESIYYLFEMINKLQLCEILIFTNFKMYFTNDELREIYKMSIYKGIKLFIIEGEDDRFIKEYEQKVIIDENYDDFFIN